MTPWTLANGTGKAVVKQAATRWFFLTADYAFGHALERDTTDGGQGERRQGAGRGARTAQQPPTSRRSCCRRRPRRRKIIGLANAGGDTINSIKQAAEFGIAKGGQRLAGLLVFITDVHALGLQTAQGMIFTESFYWDHERPDARLRQAVRRQQDKGMHPTMVHAGVYAAMLHYLKAVEALNSDDGTKVVAKMKEMPTDDPLFGKGTIRADGRKVHDVSDPGEDAGRIEGAVGLLQGARDDPGRPGLPAAHRGRLPAGEMTWRPFAPPVLSGWAGGSGC